MSDDNALTASEPNQYYDRHFKMNTTKILPGQYYVTAKNVGIVTVLGSCVSVCLRDTHSGIGGMNHFMLPQDGNPKANKLSVGGRYGVQAMELLINEILKMGGARSRLEAKVFGGGNVLNGYIMNDIGKQNVEFTLDFLKNEGIPVVAQDLLDFIPRKVYYFPLDGKAMVKRLGRVNNETIFSRERDYSAKLFHAKVEGAAELFT